MLRPLLVALFAMSLACDVGTYGDPVDGGPGGSDGGTLPLTFNGQISQDTGVCIACHGAGLQEGGYRVDSYAEITGAGDDAIPNVDIGNPLASELIIEVDPNQAPRAEHSSYATAARVQLYTDWIMAGAPE